MQKNIIWRNKCLWLCSYAAKLIKAIIFKWNQKYHKISSSPLVINLMDVGITGHVEKLRPSEKQIIAT